MQTLVIARLTFLEASRRRIMLAALLLGIAFIALYATGFYFLNQEAVPDNLGPAGNILRNQIYNFLVTAGLYAINFLTLVMAALISSDTLAGEISNGSVQSVVSKPIRRVDVVFGKWLGFAGLLGLYLILMIGGVMITAYVIAGYVVPNLIIGSLVIYLEALVIMSLTLACSSTLSTLATGGVVFGLYGLAFIGGFVEQIGAIFKNQTAVNIGIISTLIMPSEPLFRRAVSEMSSPLAQSTGFNMGPFSVASVPSPAMVVYGALYLLAALGLAIYQFTKRDL